MLPHAYHPHDLAVVCPSFLVLVVTKRGDVVVKVDGDGVIVVVMLGREREWVARRGRGRAPLTRAIVRAVGGIFPTCRKTSCPNQHV